MIYLWENPECISEEFLAVYNTGLSPDRFLFKKGIPLTNKEVNEKPIFEYEMLCAEAMQFDCIPNHHTLPLVNQKVVNLLLKLAPTDLQFFDSEIRCKDGLLTEYKLLNVISTLTGIDHEKSFCERIDGMESILGFINMRYKLHCMGSHHLARDAEYLSNLLVIEEMG